MRLVLLGPPGAGKGTQSVILAKQYKVPHISTGDILRESVKNGASLGLKAKSYMDKGELVPDDVVIGIAAERLKMADCKGGFILDGFPRTLKQAEGLDEALKGIGSGIDLVLYFETGEQVAITRLTGRRVCRKCGFNYHIKNIPPKKEGICDKCGGELFQRPDDTETTVRNRLVVYEQQTKPLIAYYEKKGVLKKVSGDLDVQELNDVLSKVFSEAQLV
ncbi:MAG: adenylate kinase [Candidatus Omnitrophica bacterium]|nr:adenylate kinase [Candidatus Omnitrophota bacterium]